MLRAEPAPRVLTVTQLAALVRETLEGGVGRVWVAGEISNLRPAPSGHVYFTLKDEQSQLGAVLFRSAAQVLAFRPADGMEVLVSARVGLYPPRGALQLYVDTMEPRGLGALQLALEQLKARLGAEGLFAAGRKRPLPRFPRAVGIVTALGGAVIHDTPTAAASLVVPDREEVAAGLARAEAALRRALARRVAAARERVAGLERALGDPARRVRDLGQRIDDLAARVRRGLLRRLAWERREVMTLATRLARSGPAPGLPRARERMAAAGERLRFALAVRVRHARGTVEQAAGRLDALSPLACLERGYAIVRRGDSTGPVVRDADTLAAGDAVALVFARGRARARVEGTEPEKEP